MKRLFTSLFLVSFIGSNIQIPSLSAQEPSPFADVYSDYEYKASIEYLKEKNIVEGYETSSGDEEDRQFRPDYQINRAELTKIMVEAQYTQEEIDQCLSDKEMKDWKTVYFTDVNIDDWFAKHVCMAEEKGIVDGYPDGTFKPTQAVNFAEASKVIANTLNLKKGTTTDEHWFTPFVEALEDRKGIPPSIRSFRKNITRGEMARMIHAGKELVADEALALSKLQELDQKQDELPQVDSCDVLIDKLGLDEPQYDYYYDKSMMGDGDIMEENAQGEVAPQAPAPTTTESRNQATDDAASGAGAVANEYSQTNVQVKGVDEADIIKNDGKYIYLIKGNTIRIVEAYPGTALKELSTIEVDDADFVPQEMYIDDNQMVIIGHVYRYRDYPYPMPMMENRMMMTDAMIWPGPSFDSTRMKVYVYSIRDKENPRKQRSIEMEGNYTSSRKVGKNVYFVLNQYIPYYFIQKDQPADVILPLYRDSAEGNEDKPLVRCTGVQYFPNFQDRNYMIVAGLNISDLNSDLNRKVVLGSSQNIYASRDNLYVAAPHYQEVRIRDGRDVSYENQQTTLVYRFKLAQDEVEYQNQGFVPGNILNQFSMDESGETFRIATTTDSYNPVTGSSATGNNLYVLNRDSMAVSGKIEDIAPGERIKSVRFIGNRGYMVTFKNVDPLFVIDLKDPVNPTILGKLKIPGWSDYLHPYDENHLIGFGREVDPKGEDAEFLTSEFLMGMKLSIFDVTDVANPKETHKEVIGARGTTSELLYNHKALLFDKEKNLLAFPITITEKKSESSTAYDNIQTVFQGGIIYSVDLTNGFKVKGKVTHHEDDTIFENSGEWFYGNPGRAIQRMLYIGEYLYSVSPDYVRSYMLDTAKSVGFIKLEGGQQDDVDYLPSDEMGL
jgi:uncharacterized secreted protein with C-terminal beta-propeller domain